eukprot:COSAG01_NODE_5891_length_3967_cov_16.745863_2_plen_104_part_00
MHCARAAASQQQRSHYWHSRARAPAPLRSSHKCSVRKAFTRYCTGSTAGAARVLVQYSGHAQTGIGPAKIAALLNLRTADWLVRALCHDRVYNWDPVLDALRC